MFDWIEWVKTGFQSYWNPAPTKARSASEAGLYRSNSVSRTDQSLEVGERRRVRDGDAPLASGIVDTSVIAVYSREASAHFATQDWYIMEHNPTHRATASSRTTMNAADQVKLQGKLRTDRVGVDFETQVRSLLQDRNIPHVLAVIEGKDTADSFTIRPSIGGKQVNLRYSNEKFLQGKNKSNVNDDKQNMIIYLRDDLKGAYSFNDVSVPRLGSKGWENIKCIGVDYKTIDGHTYRSLIVHIPNKFSKGADKDITHNAIRDYAQDVFKSSNGSVIVTGYLGDTNFVTAPSGAADAAPSIGGYNSQGLALEAQGSGSGTQNTYMQSVGLPKPAGKEDLFEVKKPSATNYVFVNTDQSNKIATDHPSFIHYTSHTSPILGRDPKMLPEYYQAGEEQQGLFDGILAKVMLWKYV